jgi:hypothetical protein
MLLGSRVTEAGVRVTKASNVRATIMGHVRRAAGGALNAYKTCKQAVAEPQQYSSGLLTTREAPL